jgi:hypothetical protein
MGTWTDPWAGANPKGEKRSGKMVNEIVIKILIISID